MRWSLWVTFLGNISLPFPSGMHQFLHSIFSHTYPAYFSTIAPIALQHTVCSHAYLFLCEETLLKARTMQQMMGMSCPRSPLLTLSSPEAVADSYCMHWHSSGSSVMSIIFANWRLFLHHENLFCMAAEQLRSVKNVMLSGANFNQWGEEICR